MEYAKEVLSNEIKRLDRDIRRRVRLLSRLEDLPDEEFNYDDYRKEEEDYFEILRKKDELIMALYKL